MNSKILVLYVAHFINDFSLSQYYKLKNELPKGYDIAWWLDDTCASEAQNIIDGIKFIKFPHNTIHPTHLDRRWFNPMKYMEILYKNDDWFNSYDFYWIVEYDVYFSGNWKLFFNTIDKYNEDLVGTSFTIYKHNRVPLSYRNDISFKILFKDLPKRVKSYISIYRISNRALKYISYYHEKEIDLDDESDIRNYLYEVYIPTILYNNNFTILSLNSEKMIREEKNYKYDYSDLDFVNFYNDCGFIDDAVNTFWWDKIFYNKDEMDKPNLLYTRYKPKPDNI
jgi:hypothetical protein